METIKCIAKKWGNSIGVRIPKEIAEKEELVAGKAITVSIRAL